MEVGINRKPLCDFLLVINTDILSRTVSELSQFVVQILDTTRFWAPFGGLETTSDVCLWLIGKRVVVFLLVLIKIFSLGVTAETLRAKIDWNRRFTRGWGSACTKFSQGDVPHQSIIYTRIDRRMNALQLCRWRFHTKKLQASAIAISLQRRQLDPNFQVEGVAPSTISLLRKLRKWSFFRIKILAELSSVFLQSTRLTDRQTDIRTAFSWLDRARGKSGNRGITPRQKVQGWATTEDGRNLPWGMSQEESPRKLHHCEADLSLVSTLAEELFKVIRCSLMYLETCTRLLKSVHH